MKNYFSKTFWKKIFFGKVFFQKIFGETILQKIFHKILQLQQSSVGSNYLVLLGIEYLMLVLKL